MTLAESPRDERGRTRGYLLVAIAASAWGVWKPIFVAAEARGPVSAAIESTIVMSAITLVGGVTMLRDRLTVRASLADWALIAWLAIGDAANAFLFFRAYELTSVAVAVLSHYLAPVFVAILSPLVLRERLSRRTIASVVLSLFGLALLLKPWAAQARPGDTQGALFGALSAIFYASNVLVNKRLSRVFSGSEMIFYHGLVAVPILALLVDPGGFERLTRGSATVLLCGGLGPGALGGLFFVWGLRSIPASHASTLTLLEPLVAVLLAAALYDDKLGVLGVAGGMLILAGAYAVIRDGGSLRASRACP